MPARLHEQLGGILFSTRRLTVHGRDEGWQKAEAILRSAEPSHALTDR